MLVWIDSLGFSYLKLNPTVVDTAEVSFVFYLTIGLIYCMASTKLSVQFKLFFYCLFEEACCVIICQVRSVRLTLVMLTPD